jgi:hypothetical protein
MTASADNAKIITVVCPFCNRSPLRDERQMAVEGTWLSTGAAELKRKDRATGIRGGRGGKPSNGRMKVRGQGDICRAKWGQCRHAQKVIAGGSVPDLGFALDYETKRFVPFRNNTPVLRDGRDRSHQPMEVLNGLLFAAVAPPRDGAGARIAQPRLANISRLGDTGSFRSAA